MTFRDYTWLGKVWFVLTLLTNPSRTGAMAKKCDRWAARRR